MAGEPGLAPHWDDAYAQGETTRSWFEQQPDMSLRMLGSAGISAADAVIDVGGGASPLAQTLLKPAARYSPAQLADELGDQWRLIGQDRQEHITHRPGSSSPSPGWRCASRHDCRPQHLPYGALAQLGQSGTALGCTSPFRSAA